MRPLLRRGWQQAKVQIVGKIKIGTDAELESRQARLEGAGEGGAERGTRLSSEEDDRDPTRDP